MKPGIHYHCPACEQAQQMSAQRFADLMKHQSWPCDGCNVKLEVNASDRPALAERIGQYRQQASKHLLPIGLLLVTIVMHLNGVIGDALLALGFALSFVGLMWVRRLTLPSLTLAVSRLGQGNNDG
ncbi:hypothetical protein [Ferrimonas balearica]|uniref:hypothetical protein n=1 Tax=Ferrimonas balearica TaxID=44012 RepID=UPI001F2E7C18|nr:hypothetical protein [Ferrimonas balearica]MBY6093329.1 hypothetical protein [Ferrimonas balearica]